MFKNVKFCTKLFVGFGLLIVICISVGLSGYNGLGNFSEAAYKAEDDPETQHHDPGNTEK